MLENQHWRTVIS